MLGPSAVEYGYTIKGGFVKQQAWWESKKSVTKVWEMLFFSFKHELQEFNCSHLARSLKFPRIHFTRLHFIPLNVCSVAILHTEYGLAKSVRGRFVFKQNKALQASSLTRTAQWLHGWLKPMISASLTPPSPGGSGRNALCAHKHTHTHKTNTQQCHNQNVSPHSNVKTWMWGLYCFFPQFIWISKAKTVATKI